jgi:Spy/CpxP family protein refolding chaperone
MKNVVLFLGVLLLSASFAGAQPDPDEMDENRRNKIETLKRAYISEKLELTVAEAEKFWPIYNEFDAQRETLRKSMRASNKKLKDGTASEKETLALIDEVNQKRKDEIDLETKFLKDAMPVLGAKKVMKLTQIQKDFQRELMKRIKERREELRENRPGPRRN